MASYISDPFQLQGFNVGQNPFGYTQNAAPFPQQRGPLQQGFSLRGGGGGGGGVNPLIPGFAGAPSAQQREKSLSFKDIIAGGTPDNPTFRSLLNFGQGNVNNPFLIPSNPRPFGLPGGGGPAQSPYTSPPVQVPVGTGLTDQGVPLNQPTNLPNFPPPIQTGMSPQLDVGSLGSVNDALGTAGAVNQFNLGYYDAARNADPAYQAAIQLLNPNNAQANYDVSMHGAEGAIGRGIGGSGAAAETTGRLRQADIERRQMEGSQLLSSIYGRTPTPFDVSKQLLTPEQRGSMILQQADLNLRDKIQSGQLNLDSIFKQGTLSLDAARLALQDKIQSGDLNLQQARLLLDWYKATHPFYGGGGYGGGGRGTGTDTGTTAPRGATPPTGGQSILSLPQGPFSASAPPPIIPPDNWASLTPDQQAQYAAAYRNNPYNYLDPTQNPYEYPELNTQPTDWNAFYNDPTLQGFLGTDYFGDQSIPPSPLPPYQDLPDMSFYD
jgi:hypothetical protein